MYGSEEAVQFVLETVRTILSFTWAVVTLMLDVLKLQL
jgi:hypothetical protein